MNFLIFLSLSSSFLIKPVSASDEYFPYLNDNFITTVQPISPRPDQFGADVSEVGVTKFTNLGIFGTTEDSVIYHASVDLKIIFNLYSLLDISGADISRRSIASLKKMESFEWLNILPSASIWDWDTATRYYFDVNYVDFDFALSNEAKCNGVNLDVNYLPLEQRGLTFKGQDITAVIPSTEVHFLKILGGSHIEGELANYEDRFANYDEQNAREYGEDDDVTEQMNLDLGQAQASVTYEIDRLNLGASYRVITTETEQPKFLQELTYGSTTEVNQDDHLNKDLNLKIEPQVKKYNQIIDIRYAEMSVLTQDGIFNQAGIYWMSPVGHEQIQRCAGIHIDNYYIQQEITVKLLLESELQLDVPLTDTFLGIPQIQRGDMIWDLAITGTTDATIVETLGGFSGLFGWLSDIENLIWTIVGFVLLGVALYVGLKFLPVIVRAGKARAEGKLNKRVQKG